MNTFKLAIKIALVSLVLAPSFASAASASVQTLSPGAVVMAKTKVTFTIATVEFIAQTFQIADSFGGSTVSSNNFDGGGNFQWVPLVNDVGTHTLTITARDFNGNEAQTTQTITVLPPPSVSIQSVNPSGNIMPGTKLTFNASAIGFTSPNFILGDEFGGSSISSATVDASGNVAWTPDISQTGKHRITVYVNDTKGYSASASLDVQVGAGPRLVVQMTSTSTTVKQGEFVSFNIAAVDFLPTGYSLQDSFSGQSSVSNANINQSGAFWWLPQPSDAGVHKITIFGQVGAFGDKASTTQVITVLGPGGVLPATNSATTSVTASSTTLSALQTQLAALMAKMNGIVPGAPPASTGVVFTLYMKPGDRNDEVLALQKVLAGLGLLSATPNGYFGVGTTAAIKEFQKQHGLEQLGVVGPATRAALNALSGASAQASASASVVATNAFKFEHFMGYGDDTLPDVLELQKKLKVLGYMSGEPTGFYGSATEAAVKKFQTAKGLLAVGYCDKLTRAELNK